MAAAPRCGIPRSKWRAAWSSSVSASFQRPAAVRMPPYGDGLAQQGLTGRGVGLGVGAHDQHPAALGPVLAGLLQYGPGPGEPAALDRPVAEDVAGDPGDRAGRPAGGHAPALPAVGGRGPLVVGGRLDVLALQVPRLGQALQGLARLGLGHGQNGMSMNGEL
jgi:hypothetical protein